MMIVVLYFGINYLKGQNFFSRDRIYYAMFDQTGDLSNSSPVLIKGVRVGVVSDIRYDPRLSDSVRVTLRIKPRYGIPVDSRAVIYVSDILGGKAIRIDVGKEKRFLDDEGAISTASRTGDAGSMDMDYFKNRLADLTANLNKTLDALNIILNDNTEDLRNTMSNLASLTANLNRLTASQSDNVSTILANVKALTTTLNGYTANFNHIVGNVESFTDSLNRARLPQVVANLNSTVGELQTMVNRMNSNDGTIGLLINDKTLYDSLVRAASGASLLLEDIKANPKNYVNFSLFGGRKK